MMQVHAKRMITHMIEYDKLYDRLMINMMIHNYDKLYDNKCKIIYDEMHDTLYDGEWWSIMINLMIQSMITTYDEHHDKAMTLIW